MYSNLNMGKVAIVIIVVILVLAIAIPSCTSFYATKEYTVTVTDKDIKNYSESSKFLVFTKLENGETKVFSIEDSRFKGRWNSADCYADIEVGKTYKIETIGWRIPLFSDYENIMDFTEIE